MLDSKDNQRLIDVMFDALVKEAQFTREMLGAGATKIRIANYATRGVYFEAFTSLSTGLERIGKLCLILDRLIETRDGLPDLSYLKTKIGHDLTLLYTESKSIICRAPLLSPF